MESNYLKVFNILLSLLVYTNVYASLTQGTLPDNDEIDFGYTKKPDTSTSDDNPVIGSNGNFNVTQTGAATYSYNIAVPQGVGGLNPSLAVVYNSQKANGVVGWGNDISGVSVITRGVKTVYHDGAAKGITHTENDAYYIDGTRLILVSGSAGCSGAVYHPENSPSAIVTFHGTGSSLWIDVKTKDGIKLTFGNTRDSRQSYKNKAGLTRVNAWYINRAEDSNGNYMTYSYLNDNGMVYPLQITYGMNMNKSTGISNFVKFVYEQRADKQELYMEDFKATSSLRLKSIESGTGNSVYRHYDFTYTTDSQAAKPYSRLHKITEQNSTGEKRKPVEITWNSLPAFSQKTVTPDINLKESSTVSIGGWTNKTEIANEIFLACDMTGDGLDDIIEIASLSETESYPGYSQGKIDTPVYIYKASKNNGVLSYNLALTYYLGFSGNILGIDCNKLATYQLDFDGDCLADICVPENVQIDNSGRKYINFKLVRGKEVSGNTLVYKYFGHLLKGSDKTPNFASADVDNNGRTEIIVVEKSLYDGSYVCEILGHKSEEDISRYEFGMKLPSVPENIFTGDFNNDGMQDIMVFYNGGYKIYFNRGGQLEGGSIFSENSIKTGTSIGYVARMFQGDFNGDGLVDFLLNSTNNRNWYFALGCGDGTFNKILACSSDLYKHNNGKDDDKMQCIVFDFDNDGKTDVVMVNYVDETQRARTHWMRSTGQSLVNVRQTWTSNADDALSSRFAVGNFTGNGQPELMNYGYDCYNGEAASSSPKIHIYHNDKITSASGKVVSLTNETGRTINITYAPFADHDVYSRGSGSSYPVVDCVPPLQAVKEITTDNGAAGDAKTTYRYSGLKLHVAGRGMLGMSSVVLHDNITGNRVETGIEAWDAQCFAPARNVVSKMMGSSVERTTTENTYTVFGNGTFALKKTVIETKDPDMFYSTTYREYDPQTETLLSEKEEGDCMDNYHETVYSNFIEIAGKQLPQTLTYNDCHVDDVPVEHRTTIIYDSKGRKVQECVNAGSSMPVTKEYTYDDFGNITSTSTYGNGVEKTKNVTEYDTSGRFVTKEYTVPATSVTGYTHDTWGNVLTATDMTNAAYPLVTLFTYDTWGNKREETSPTGALELTIQGWNGSNAKRYYTLKQADGEPWVKTWYDSMGREVLVESVGLKDIDIKTEREYDKYGLETKVTTYTGDICVTTSKQYDRRGRIISEISSNAGTVTYSYSGTHVTINDNGREYSRVNEDRGYIRSASDPAGEVEYTYNSFFKPVSVDVLGCSGLTLEYDDLGNRTVLNDPDGGRTTYTYDALGRVRTQTDARGNKTSYTFDAVGRKTHVYGDDTLFAEYTYGVTGSSAQRLVKEKRGDLYTTYTYDGQGRVSSKTCHVNGEDLVYNYTYDKSGQVTRIVYPGGVTADYAYDCYGNNTSISIGDKTVWNIEDYTGKTVTTRFGSKLFDVSGFDDSGRNISRILKKNSGSDVLRLLQMSCSYDKATGNLKSRNIEEVPIGQEFVDSLSKDSVIFTGPIKGLENTLALGDAGTFLPGSDLGQFFIGQKETYSYDTSDRLIQVNRGNKVFQTLEYDDNGNILVNTRVGTYNYDDEKIHAVTSIDVAGNKYSPGEQDVSYNFFGKAETVSDWSGGEHRELYIVYGPDMERWESVLYINGEEKRRILYSDDYECVKENGVTRQFYYIGGNVIYLKETGADDRICYTFTDNQGSLIRIVDENGAKLFESVYDAWGKQSVSMNRIGFIRGYTGHEMLPEFGLINMNGRMYDPVVARFLSPDNYVQMPENTQNFNRYSYCLNNPLKYTDPTGEFWSLVIGAAVGGVFNWAAHGFQFNAKGLGYFTTGAVAGAISTGVASGINVAMAGGSFWSGAAGLAQGVASTGFWAGAAAGASAGFAGGFILGAGNSWIDGNGFGKGLRTGFVSGSISALSSGITSGLLGGLSALDNGVDFWTGTGSFSTNGAMACSNCMPSDFKVGENTVTGKYVGKFKGISVYETEQLGNVNNHYRAVTIPERGIIAAKGVFTSGTNEGVSMMQHEFGHILQYCGYGPSAYWSVIAPESLASATFNPSAHGNFWTETWANYLSANYFGKFWIGGSDYPIKNISLFNKLRLIVAKSIVSTVTHLGI